MKIHRFSLFVVWVMWAGLVMSPEAQTLINLDFGGRSPNGKSGFAATGLATNDWWNLYRHYDPKFIPGMPLVTNGLLARLKYADGTDSNIAVAVTNAPGVWGNATGDPMYDTYIFSQDGSNMTVTVSGLAPGRYHFYLYGHADPDVLGEQNSSFTLQSGTNHFGPLTTLGSAGWKAASSWQERYQYVVFRDIAVFPNRPVVIEVGSGGVGSAVLNGLQIFSRGTSPTDLMPAAALKMPAINTNLVFSEVRYDGKITDDEARFEVAIAVVSETTNEISSPLFAGDLALLAPELPDGLRLVSGDKQCRLFASAPGAYRFKLDLVAKIQRGESWNQVAFTGPPAAIASLTAQAGGTGVELQLMSGTPLETDPKGGSRLQGLLGADRLLSLRWQNKTAEVARKSFVTVETIATAQITPTVIKFNTQLCYDILQSAVPKLTIALPATHALTRLQGEQIRDWRVEPITKVQGMAPSAQLEGASQILTVEFIKPVEKNYQLNLISEQTIDTTPLTTTLALPQPLEIERETGSLTLAADDMLVEIESAPGLRQINAPSGTLAAYRFNGRPFSLAAKLTRIEPVIKVADRVTARLEETRLLVNHTLAFTVEKAGTYAVELTPQTNLVVAAVTGEGIDDWKIAGGKLQINFTHRVQGSRQVEVQLEQPLKEFPNQIVVMPLRVSGAAQETTEIGAAATLGLRAKTSDLAGLREIPISRLARRTDELLAYVAEQPDWRLTLATERLAARIVAEIFNLVTIGDGLVGGSATVRLGLINQGVQEIRVKVPDVWKNVEFTGPGIRRKENQGTNWVIGLQDKAWGGYTLVITYDFSFDPKGASLAIGGAHVAGVERETGSLAITTATGLQLQAKAIREPLRRIDELALNANDRTLIARPVLLAYRYAGETFELALEVTRFDPAKLLEAVADRTQLTTVLTENGQMLTQASFMVKNNEKQFQRFRLPVGAEFWSCYVNGQAAKAERDGEWLLVPLPREANRDQAFAVDLVYAQTIRSLHAIRPQKLMLEAPQTDVPNTYAEWELHIPYSQRVSGFAGTMNVKRGTTYHWHDAWQKFIGFYLEVYHEAGVTTLFFGGAVVMLIVLGLAARRHGWRGLAASFGLLCLLAILAGMMLPALSKAKAKAQRIRSDQEQRAADEYALSSADRSAQLQTNAPIAERFQAGGQMVNVPQQVPNTDASQFQQRLTTGPGQPMPAQPPPNRPAMSPEMARRYGFSARGVAGAIDALANAPATAVASPTAAGIRPIRIEIPRQGQPFTFTKVLNLSEEKLTVQARIMSARVLVTLQALLQAMAFLLGLSIVWWNSRDTSRSSFRVTIGLLFSLGAVAHLLITRRWLHYALILAAPLLILLVLVWVVNKFWPRPQAPTAPSAGAGGSGRVSPPSALAAIIIGCYFAPGPGYAATEVSARALRSDIPMVSMAPTSPMTNAVSLLSAKFTGQVSNGTARFEATMRLISVMTNQTIKLFSDEVAVQQFSATPTNVQLLRGNRGLNLHLPDHGQADIQLKFLVKLGGDVSQRELRFGMPAVLYNEFSLQIDEAEAEIEFPTAVSFKRITESQKTRVEAVLGAGDGVDVLWKPRVKRAAEIAATVFCQNTALVTVGGGVVNTRSTLDYQISQGELRQLRVQLPASQRLLRVEGQSIRTWSVAPASLPTVATNPSPAEIGRGLTNQAPLIVTVELLKSVSPNYQLMVETEKVLEPLPTQLGVAIPHALDIKRETGWVAVRGGEELSLTLDGKEMQRVDPEEFARTASEKAEGVISAFRFLKPDFALTVRAELVKAQVEAVVHNALTIGVEQAGLVAQVDYTIKRAGLFALRLTLPAEYRLEKVTGANVLQWLERKEPAARLLEVTLKERIMGRYTLQLELTRPLKELPKTFAVEGVYPLGTEKLTGFVSVASELGVAVKTASFEGLTEVPAATLADLVGRGANTLVARQSQTAPTANQNAFIGNAEPSLNNRQQQAAQSIGQNVAVNPDLANPSGNVLAFKFISTAPGPVPPWKLVVANETVEPWVRVEAVHFFTLTETLLSGRALLRYDIANAPVKELRLRIPAAFKNVEISGGNIRRRDQTNDQWRVELQSKVRGNYLLTVTWEQPSPAKTNRLELVGPEAVNVERETGMLAIEARPPLQVTEKSPGDLLKMDVQDLSPWAGRPNAATVLAYRYLRPGYKLDLEMQRYEEAEVLQALVDQARLTTVVAEDGQMMTEVVLSIRNHGRQHLEIEPPAGARIWSAFVAGQPVWPSQRAGKWLLPLESSGSDDAPISAEIILVGSQPFPRSKGTVELISPKLDVPLKNARWELYLPPDYDYRGFAGTMIRESLAVAAPATGSYTIHAYAQQENRKQIAWNEEVQSSLRNAQRQLKEGNVKEAVANYRQVRSNVGKLGATGNQDLQQLERDLNRSQGMNLLKSQNDFSFLNGVVVGEPLNFLGAGQNAQAPANSNWFNNDNTAAEKQWAKLQQAQEVTVAKVQPLRVNLPTAGLPFAFSQVLQTELRKPMTIVFYAASTKTSSWGGRIFYGLIGFVIFWAGVAWRLNQFTSRKT